MKNTSELIERIIKLQNDKLDVYIQRKNSKVIAIPEMEGYMDFMDFENDDYELLYNEIEANPKNFFKVEPLTSREIYNIMMDFALEQERTDSVVLVKALRTNRPYDEFRKELMNIGAVINSAWQMYYSDRIKRIIRSRLCKEHIHLISEKCS
ncbi:UPF0158 family protein [Carboxylicivirga marina]|uniref:UPF0158 family protein n=1 Tax=Carboxylicivirga marina TaxID=2800988 RepID=UPI002592E036|nr:UPF0158 family protein [uncultured Carboxylicivirga sp.]